MAVLYTYTFAPGDIESTTALPATFYLTPLSPDEGATYATVSSITTMFYAPSVEGTYVMKMMIKIPGGDWSDYSEEDVIWAGESTQVITFTFDDVAASISNDRFEIYIAKDSGPPRTTYIAIDDTKQYFVVSGEWAGIPEEGGPEKPINPTPADTASNVTLDQETVTWEDGGDADTYNVYYGDTSGDLTLLSEEQTGLSFTIDGITLGSPFDYSVTRYWRIDAENDAGLTEGDEWSFTSIVFDPPVPTAAGSATPNIMQIIKRLVVAANSKIWYEDI